MALFVDIGGGMRARGHWGRFLSSKFAGFPCARAHTRERKNAFPIRTPPSGGSPLARLKGQKAAPIVQKLPSVEENPA